MEWNFVFYVWDVIYIYLSWVLIDFCLELIKLMELLVFVYGIGIGWEGGFIKGLYDCFEIYIG